MKKRKYNQSVYRSLAMISNFGIHMIVPIVMCSLLGWYLDMKLGTSFWMILLFFIGAIAGFRNIYRMAKNIYEDKGNKDEKND